MKVKPYQFGLATISGFQDHSNVPRLRTDRNQLVNIYLITFQIFAFFEKSHEFIKQNHENHKMDIFHF